jgi:hypothetical protein
MGASDIALYAWLFPVIGQIVLPLVVLFGWMVIKLPLSLLGRDKSTTLAEQALAS